MIRCTYIYEEWVEDVCRVRFGVEGREDADRLCAESRVST